ncbi:gluconokinase [Consotaella aegiceratis]|uniref:gluconokinase n=1 Tax=Consotaella aegiceratis TaxID=3097961 RepID=UPI002F3ECEF0
MKSTSKALIVMGPAGVGKTTTARILAERLGWQFAEADDFHPPENIAKMSHGIPLQDEDRWPWLSTIRDWISAEACAGRSVVATCSALKRSYRDILRAADADVRFLFLAADASLVAERLAARSGHYMPASLLASQFGDLEPLETDEPGIAVTIDKSAKEVADEAIRRFMEAGWRIRMI